MHVCLYILFPFPSILFPSFLFLFIPLTLHYTLTHTHTYTHITEVSRHLFDTCGVEPLQKHIPACSEHYAVLNASKLGSFQLLSPADGHGPMHVQVRAVHFITTWCWDIWMFECAWLLLCSITFNNALKISIEYYHYIDISTHALTFLTLYSLYHRSVVFGEGACRRTRTFRTSGPLSWIRTWLTLK